MRNLSVILNFVLPSLFLLISCKESSKEVTIGEQIWMVENLDVDMFKNGESIPQAKTAEEWEIAGKNNQPAWCYHENDPENGKVYGKIYNWYAVIDPRGLAPENWKIPTDEDWILLINYFGGDSIAGKKMKSADFWPEIIRETDIETNYCGFKGLPGGDRYDDGEFGLLGEYGSWWSSTENNKNTAWAYSIDYFDDGAHKVIINKEVGLSVRCLKY